MTILLVLHAATEFATRRVHLLIKTELNSSHRLQYYLLQQLLLLLLLLLLRCWLSRQHLLSADLVPLPTLTTTTIA